MRIRHPIIAYGALCAILLMRCGSSDEPNSIESIIAIGTEKGDSLYFTTKVWGISGNHQSLALSTHRAANSKDSGSIQINEELPVYYKVNHDVLTLYLRDSLLVPPRFTSTIAIDQVILGPLDYIRFIDTMKTDNYEVIAYPIRRPH